MSLKSMEKATFAAGCFWRIEAAFREVEGVISTRVGWGRILEHNIALQYFIITKNKKKLL
ncbi:MAG: peptide-methionine (S)-S-oxide reductase [Methanohalophilus sp.]|nr:MAG: peptide-methionine (S)-S-oxide reductase [Methanohalophilus sp.]